MVFPMPIVAIIFEIFEKKRGSMGEGKECRQPRIRVLGVLIFLSDPGRSVFLPRILVPLRLSVGASLGRFRSLLLPSWRGLQILVSLAGEAVRLPGCQAARLPGMPGFSFVYLMPHVYDAVVRDTGGEP